jgi:hypothetical protein
MMARWRDNFMKFNLGGVMFCPGGKRKTVEDEAATKDGIEVGDDDMTKDWNHGLMMTRRSLGTTKLTKARK